MAISANITGPTPLIRWGNLGWVGLALAVMIAAIASDSLWFLNFVHVMAGLLWTGIDLFMGFVLGPVQRRLDLPARRALATRLMPRMLFLMPTLAIITGTAGSALAARLGFYDLDYPAKAWVIAALVVIAILTIQGLFILLPTNVRVCLEIAKENPDLEMVSRRMRVYVRMVAFQGAMQVLMIVIMARFATGL
jgi:uncharacterized membrane protein